MKKEMLGFLKKDAQLVRDVIEKKEAYVIRLGDCFPVVSKKDYDELEKALLETINTEQQNAIFWEHECTKKAKIISEQTKHAEQLEQQLAKEKKSLEVIEIFWKQKVWHLEEMLAEKEGEEKNNG